MRTLFCLLTAVSFVLGADSGIRQDDQWAAVKKLKSGTEIRVFKIGAAQPVLAKAGDATDDKLIIVVKNAQTAIDRNAIDRIDARPAAGKRATVTSTATSNEPTAQAVDGVRPENYPKPGSSYSSGISMGSKPDFETIYKRRAGK